MFMWFAENLGVSNEKRSKTPFSIYLFIVYIMNALT